MSLPILQVTIASAILLAWASQLGCSNNDGSMQDSGSPDPPEVGPPDVDLSDAEHPDVGPLDAGVVDAGVVDAGVLDAKIQDTEPSQPDAGPTTPSRLIQTLRSGATASFRLDTSDLQVKELSRNKRLEVSLVEGWDIIIGRTYRLDTPEAAACLRDGLSYLSFTVRDGGVQAVVSLTGATSNPVQVNLSIVTNQETGFRFRLVDHPAGLGMISSIHGRVDGDILIGSYFWEYVTTVWGQQLGRRCQGDIRTPITWD